MNYKNFIFFIVICCAVYLISITDSGCAQIGAPTGGPRDSIPPVLLNANPPEQTLHFKGDKIVFTYDEYVQLLKLQENLLINPTPKITPNVDYKLKTVTIRIRDTLQPNTTYRFDFGNAIADNNEGNPVKNFSYVFSTGAYIDSLEVSGKVQLAETGKSDSTLLVFLYKNLDDSAIYKEKPKFTTRLDSSGNFTFYNLPGGTYHIYALKDESGQKVYDHDDELFAFSDSVISVSDSLSPIKLFAYNQVKPVPKTSSLNNGKPEKKLKYTSSITNNTQDLLTPIMLTFNHKLKNFDSTKIELADTLLNPYKAIISIDTTGKKITIQNQWLADNSYKLIIPQDFATDTSGVGLLKPDTIRFKTKRENDYGSVTLNFKNLAKFKNPVLQFISNGDVVKSYALTSSKLYIKLFNPGDYELRILEDTNNNGTWDPGNYHLKLQPEKVYAIPMKLSLRADWDNDKDIEL